MLKHDPNLARAPQLASIGDGYVSVQKTVRELKDSDFYEFFDALPFMPIVVVGQGSRIKKLGAKQYRRTSNFSGPHKLVTDKQGIRRDTRCTHQRGVQDIHYTKVDKRVMAAKRSAMGQE